MTSSLRRPIELLEQSAPSDSIQGELAAARQYYADPLGFVLWAFPWGKGTLANFTGPDDWHHDFLEQLGRGSEGRGFGGTRPVDAIRCATASGHGIGKSTLVAWIVVWIMSTRLHCQGTVNANTFTQLQTKTWAAIQKWIALSITGSWFTTDFAETQTHRARGNRFNEAATLRSRKRASEAQCTSPSRRFNEAATLRSRKRLRHRRRTCRTSSFNGAATLRSRKQVIGIQGVSTFGRFNEAATLRSRKQPNLHLIQFSTICATRCERS